MKTLVILVIVLSQAFDFFLKYLNYKHRNTPLPNNVQDVYEPEEYAKNQRYQMDKLKWSIVSGLCGLALVVLVLLLNIHSAAYDFIAPHTGNPFLRMYVMFGVVWLISLPLDILFGAVDTFGVEAKYGFNKSSVKTFIFDIIKETIVSDILISLGLLSLFVWIYGAVGNAVFVVFFGVLLAFIVLMMFLSGLQMRLFYKLTPLEDGSLKDRITALCKTIGYPSGRIFVADFSRRSTKANAACMGFGNKRTIVLADNLINDYTEDEVLCVTAHEMGHDKRKHLFKRMPMSFIMFAIVLGVAFFVVNSEAVALAFGFDEINVAFGLFVTMILAGPLLLPLSMPANALSRKHEFEADAYEVKYVAAEPAVSAIKRLAKLNYANLTPHPWVVALTYSHPPITQRIAAMENIAKE